MTFMVTHLNVTKNKLWTYMSNLARCVSCSVTEQLLQVDLDSTF